jgi:antitoxin component YwqK of YwqJK toxin-antitoxin module
LSRLIKISLLLCLTTQLGVAQFNPDLSDNIILCKQGAFPVYELCLDSVASDTGRYEGGALRWVRTKLTPTTQRWTSFYPTGKVQSTGTADSGMISGAWKFYHPNGQIKARGMFERGLFELGSAGSGNYMSATGKTGEWMFWDSLGNRIARMQFAKNEYQEESLHGPYTEWFISGQVKEEGHYKMGMKNGEWKAYYSDGQIRSVKNYVYRDCPLYDFVWYECPEGEWKYWNKNGTINRTEIYRNGILIETKSGR